MERQHNKSNLREFHQSSRISPTHNRQLPTKYRSIRRQLSFYNNIDKILETQTHYTIVMGDYNAKVGGQTNTQKGRQNALACAREMKEETLVEWAPSKNFKIMNTQFQKKAGMKWTRRSPDRNTKNEIHYIMTDKRAWLPKRPS